MRKTILLFALSAFAFVATAQQTDSAQRILHAQNNSGESSPATHVNTWFIVALGLVIVGSVFVAIWYMRRSERKVKSGWGRKKRSSSSGKRKKHRSSSSGKKSGFQNIASNPAIPEKVVKTAMPPVVKEKPAPVPEAVIAAVIAPPTPPAAPVPEVFYMTVPGADGRFGAGAKKAQPTGCLYRFEVVEGNPNEAVISFSGNEADMRNAQAFRDLELLPACTFEGRPNENTFHFDQKPGRASFDGTAWAVKEKINIRFK